MTALRILFGMAIAALALATVIQFVEQGNGRMLDRTPLPSLHAEPAMPALEGAVAWLNTKPLSGAQLRGKVVLVDFWTYSCINWHRTLPYVRAWAEKYKEQGLVVVGVHTPEFGFERDLDKIREAASQLQVGYPVAVDSNYAIWNKFGNSAWPALYLIDANGRIRHRHLGEGDYDGAERMIQKLLAEAGVSGVPGDLVQVQAKGSQAEADWSNLRSPETYLGRERTRNFSTPGGLKPGSAAYAAPESLRLNAWGLGGEWTTAPEAVRLDSANGRVVYRFHARDVNLVMGPAARTNPVPFRIRIDGKAPGAAHGSDVDAEGRGTLVEHRLYQLVRQAAPIADRTFEIEFLAPGAEVFVFTFG